MKSKAGFTLIEMIMVTMIISILSSLVIPRFAIILKRAHQGTTKSNLGIIRSSLALYYSANEGSWPMTAYADGYADTMGISMTQVLSPQYIERIPVPKLDEKVGTFNGLPFPYDNEAAGMMAYNPPKDIVIIRGPASATPLINRPYVYDPDSGALYLCNGNFDVQGDRFYQW